MSEYNRKPPGHECPPHVDPAPQPKPPANGDACGKLPETTPPDLKKPEPCPEPDRDCKCPEKPGSTSNCLEDLIAKQAAEIVAAENAEKFKKDLESLLEKAKAASQDYTRDKYEKLVEEWLKQDAAIAELIRKLVCAVPCWRCILDCFVCPLLNELHYAEKWLYDDGKLYTEVNDLYDLRYWHTRDKEVKERTFNRIKNVLTAWEKPAQTIEKALNDNRALAEAAGKVIGSEPGKAIYDVFLRLIPMHLAIAPPAGADTMTKIDERFAKFCECNQGTPDDCCGPDVGVLSLRQRLVGPQPYLIDPNAYFTLVCCLVEKRYGPAKDLLSKAQTDLADVENKIARYKSQLEDGLKNLEKTAKGAIPSVIDCCDYEPHDDDEQQTSQAR